MKVLHLFDRWLNQTMNWAHALITHTPGEHLIGADIFFNNPFNTPDLKVIQAPLQRPFSKSGDEWNIPLYQKAVGRFCSKSIAGYWEKQIEERKVDIVHFHFATFAAKHLYFISRLKVPVVISYYGYDYEHAPFQNPSLQDDYKSLFKKSAALIAEGRNGGAILSKLGAPHEKIHVVHLGMSFDTAPSNKQKKKCSLKVIQPASFTQKKGHDTSIQALLACPPMPGLKVTFMGEVADQGYYQKLIQMAQPLVESGVLEFLPFVPSDQFLDTLTDYDVLLQPSHYSTEMDCEGGAPVSLIQAQGIGLPVIATKHCDIPEVVLHSESGLLLEEHDHLGVAQAIERFYDMGSSEYARFSTAAQAHAKENYNLAQSGEDLLHVYQDLTQ